jgi:orotidine-5'-phosphate decarboxylase
MDPLFADQLIDAIDRNHAPICVGIDPIFEMLPDAVAGDPRKRNANDVSSVIDAFYAFTTGVLDAVAPVVPIVKFQVAYFERYRAEGLSAYFSLIDEAKSRGLLVIGDVKRGDIGSTCTAYAEAHLVDEHNPDGDDAVAPDAITVNPFCGLDTLEPFVTAARDHGRGLFVLVRTSNPGSAILQDARLEDGRTYSELLADELATIAEGEGLVGQYGYSSIGAVVGATQPHTMASLRKRLPRSIFLLPGYGTQGATAEMTRSAFDANGHGAIVSASRSILYAHRDKKYAALADDWVACVERATLDMQADLLATLNG